MRAVPRLSPLFVSLALLGAAAPGCDGGDAGAPPLFNGFPYAPGGPSPAGSLRGTFTLTYYWITSEGEFSDPPDTDLYDRSCHMLARVANRFARSLALEGTGRLTDGSVLNYDGACSCAFSPCFAVLDASYPWGKGVEGRPLRPFRSVAVDPQVVAIGEVLYVHELDGVRMPGEAPWGDFVHDGCVTADDEGGHITGQHLDFFATLDAYYRQLDGALGLDRVTVYNPGEHCH
jgi:3D (Asp-Asp-Asp) domain-containing protein